MKEHLLERSGATTLESERRPEDNRKENALPERKTRSLLLNFRMSETVE